MIGLRYDEKLWQYVKPFSSDTGTLRTDRQTDGRTDRIAISISHVSVLTRDKNRFAVRFRREPLGTYSTSRTPSWIFFYCATRMHSVDHAMTRRLSVRPTVRLSVCPSVTRPFVVSTATRILKLFSPSGSQTIFSFSIPNGMAIFRRVPPS